MDGPADLPLRDIHLPEPVSWWPLSPGWWILAGLVIFTVVMIVLWYRNNRRRKLSAVYLARAELSGIRKRFTDQADSVQLARELSALLRRLSVSAFPRTETASLTGINWLHYLDHSMPDQPFSSGPGRILVDAPYRPVVNKEEIEPLFDLCDAWINAVAVEVKQG